MGVYRKVYQPFGLDLNALASGIENASSGGYRTDWPGIIGTAEQIATNAGLLAPGAGVLAPSAAPPLLQAPPEGTPGVATNGGIPWLLIGGAVAIYYFVLR